MAVLRTYLLTRHSTYIVTESGLFYCSPITKFPGGPVDVPIKKAAERLGITATQVAFLWVKAKGAVIVTLVSLLFSTLSIHPVD
jgi:hypothetical protein